MQSVHSTATAGWERPYKVLPLQVRVDLGSLAMKEYFAFSKVPALLKPYHQIVSCHIWDTCWWSLTPLQICSWCIQRLQRTGTLVLRTYQMSFLIFSSCSLRVFLLYSHEQLSIHTCMQKHIQHNKDERTQLFRKIYLSLYWKGRVWEVSWRLNRTATYWPPQLFWLSQPFFPILLCSSTGGLGHGSHSSIFSPTDIHLPPASVTIQTQFNPSTVKIAPWYPRPDAPVIYTELRPGKTCHSKDGGSCIFRWPVMGNDCVGELGEQYGTRLKSHGAITNWCTRRVWPVNCMTVISTRW